MFSPTRPVYPDAQTRRARPCRASGFRILNPAPSREPLVQRAVMHVLAMLHSQSSNWPSRNSLATSVFGSSCPHPISNCGGASPPRVKPRTSGHRSRFFTRKPKADMSRICHTCQKWHTAWRGWVNWRVTIPACRPSTSSDPNGFRPLFTPGSISCLERRRRDELTSLSQRESVTTIPKFIRFRFQNRFQN